MTLTVPPSPSSPSSPYPLSTAGPTGFSLPLSPSGRASMLTPPPWHFSGEVVMVEYRADPEAVRRFLPPGLDPGPDPGAAAAVFATWQWCSENEAERSDPAANQFGEFLLLLGCAFEGRPMARCPYAWVDEPVPMVRGWLQGMPKQLGTIWQSRATTVGRGGPRAEPGNAFAGRLTVSGHRVAEVRVDLEAETGPPALHTVPLAHSLTFPAWVGEPPAPVLVASEVAGVEFGPVLTGPASLDLSGVAVPDLDELAPLEIGAGYVFSYAETLIGGVRLGS